MPRTPQRPKYRLHRASHQAVVTIGGKDHYLGEYDSPESRARYDELIHDWRLGHVADDRLLLTVDDLALLYTEHVEGYYRRPDGKPTAEVHLSKLALRPLVKLFGPKRARSFGPLALQQVRAEMIRLGWVRKSINIHLGRIKRMFAWAVSQELIPAEVHHALSTVKGLRAGRSGAKESDPVKPVPDAFIDAVKPHVSRQVWGLIQLQLATGARPGELLPIRGCDLNMSGAVWEYRPQTHKLSYQGRDRVIYIGPRGQGVLKEFLTTEIRAPLFSPADAVAEFITANYRTGAKQSRTSPRPVGEQYSLHSYQRAINRACIKAVVPPWHPHQLRHNAATALRREFGIEAARVVLGHSTAFTTEIYAELDHAKAREIVGSVG